MKKFVAKKRKEKLKQAAGFRKGVVNKLKGYRKKEKKFHHRHKKKETVCFHS